MSQDDKTAGKPLQKLGASITQEQRTMGWTLASTHLRGRLIVLFLVLSTEAHSFRIVRGNRFSCSSYNILMRVRCMPADVAHNLHGSRRDHVPMLGKSWLAVSTTSSNVLIFSDIH